MNKVKRSEHSLGAWGIFREGKTSGGGREDNDLNSEVFEGRAYPNLLAVILAGINPISLCRSMDACGSKSQNALASSALNAKALASHHVKLGIEI